MTKNINFRFKIGKHLIDGFLIFAGVFFAFLLTEYRASQKNDGILDVSM